jgi:hypothetical protein
MPRSQSWRFPFVVDAPELPRRTIRFFATTGLDAVTRASPNQAERVPGWIRRALVVVGVAANRGLQGSVPSVVMSLSLAASMSSTHGFALHSATTTRSRAPRPGEAKVYGRAIAAIPIAEGPDGERLHADIVEVVPTHPNEKATMLLASWWTPPPAGCDGSSANDPARERRNRLVARPLRTVSSLEVRTGRRTATRRQLVG